MTDVKKILEYQELDIKLKKLDREYEKLEDKKKLDTAKNEYSKLQNAVIVASNEAQKIIDDINGLHAKYKKLMDTFSAISKSINGATSDDERAKLFPELENIKNQLENIDRSINQKIKRSKDIIANCRKLQDNKKTVKAEFDKCKAKLDEYKAKVAPERQQISDKKDTILSGIVAEKPIFDRYNALRREVRLPIIVRAGKDGENYACYCGMTLSLSEKSELIDKKLCQCESCRRLIYIE